MYDYTLGRIELERDNLADRVANTLAESLVLRLHELEEAAAETAAAIKERDEARRASARWKSSAKDWRRFCSDAYAKICRYKTYNDESKANALEACLRKDAEIQKLERERDKARRELQLLLESTKVETCEPLPERDGEPADFSGAIRRMRLAEEDRDQWRECAERLAAFVAPVPADMADHTACAAALAEFERLKGETK
jgi:hypothetical protein